MFDTTTPVSSAKLAVEEDDRDYGRYKHVHAAGCTGLRDAEPVNFAGGTISNLMDDLIGYAVCESPFDETELEYFSGLLNPCARRVLGL